MQNCACGCETLLAFYYTYFPMCSLYFGLFFLSGSDFCLIRQKRGYNCRLSQRRATSIIICLQYSILKLMFYVMQTFHSCSICSSENLDRAEGFDSRAAKGIHNWYHQLRKVIYVKPTKNMLYSVGVKSWCQGTAVSSRNVNV